MGSTTLRDLLTELDHAYAYTEGLQLGLTPEQMAWRPGAESSGIGWHLGHQGAVAHFMLRNLTAAEPRIDADLDALMDSATPERDRGSLPPVHRILEYRGVVAERIRYRIGKIDDGAVGAPNQLRLIASTMLVALVNHEYQHSKWIGEIRSDVFGLDLPPLPSSPRLSILDGYVVLTDPA
jgi:hypothetical protein